MRVFVALVVTVAIVLPGIALGGVLPGVAAQPPTINCAEAVKTAAPLIQSCRQHMEAAKQAMLSGVALKPPTNEPCGGLKPILDQCKTEVDDAITALDKAGAAAGAVKPPPSDSTISKLPAPLPENPAQSASPTQTIKCAEAVKTAAPLIQSCRQHMEAAKQAMLNGVALKPPTNEPCGGLKPILDQCKTEVDAAITALDKAGAAAGDVKPPPSDSTIAKLPAPLPEKPAQPAPPTQTIKDCTTAVKNALSIITQCQKAEEAKLAALKAGKPVANNAPLTLPGTTTIINCSTEIPKMKPIMEQCKDAVIAALTTSG